MTGGAPPSASRSCRWRMLTRLFIEWPAAAGELATLQQHLRGQTYRQMLALMEMSARPCVVSFHTIRCTKDMELVHQALAKADEPR